MALSAELTVETRPNAVVFTVSIRNDGDESVDLTFPTGQTADVVVRSTDDPAEVVWRWSDDRLFTQAIRQVTLAPGESLDEELTWADPQPGTFRAEATLEATDARVSAGGRFSLR